MVNLNGPGKVNANINLISNNLIEKRKENND